MDKPKILRAFMSRYHLSKADVARILSHGNNVRTVNNVEGWLSIGQTRPMPSSSLYILKLCGKIYDLSGKWPN